MLSKNLKYNLKHLFSRIKSLSPRNPRIAAFDLDNTLIAGDIGEAVYAQLLIDKFPLRMTFRSYQELKAIDAPVAYRLMVQTMEGIEEALIRHATKVILQTQATSIFVEGAEVPVPFPIPDMVETIEWLRNENFEVHVISASNNISVQETIKHWFHLPPEWSHGVTSIAENGIITGKIIEPTPIGRGKIRIYAQSVSSFPPLITAGDSSLDYPLLSITDRKGLSIWVYESVQRTTPQKKKISFPHRMVSIRRPSRLALVEQPA